MTPGERIAENIIKQNEGAYSDYIKQVVATQINTAIAEATKPLEEALILAKHDIHWMSGSNDFSPKGKAHTGWLKIRDLTLPLIEQALTTYKATSHD